MNTVLMNVDGDLVNAALLNVVVNLLCEMNFAVCMLHPKLKYLPNLFKMEQSGRLVNVGYRCSLAQADASKHLKCRLLYTHYTA